MMKNEFRPCVGIVVFNEDKKVLLCERIDTTGGWQFPQGGIDENEDFRKAARRELFEETSIISVKEIAVINQPLQYFFPNQLLKHPKAGYIGQEMRWVLFLFTGDESEINLNTAISEFRSYAWEDIDLAPQKIVDFKRNVYINVVEKFKPIIEAYING